MTAQAVLSVAAVLFCLGLYCVLTRRNAVAVLMGVELILNAANLNFVTFSNFLSPSAVSRGPLVDGHVFALTIIVLAAAEATVALAIVLAIFRRMGTVEVDQLNKLRE